MNRLISILGRSQRYSSIVKKYQDKLNEAARNRGFESVQAMLAAQRQEQIKSHSRDNDKNASNLERLTPGSIGSNGFNGSKSSLTDAKRKLDQILKIDKIKDLDSSSISEIWNSYLSEKGSLSASISGETWSRQVLNLTKYPTFLISMPLDECFIFYFMEFSNDSIFLTRLQDYQTKGSLAEPILALYFYTDLLSDKNLVLMKADVLHDMDIKDAQYLIYQIQYWYYVGGQKTLDIIRKFHHNPKDFDYKSITEFDYFNKC